MTKHCVIICFVLLALAVRESQGSSFKTLSNAWASQYGEVSISKDSNGYYVDVDFASYPYSSSNMTKMLISLSNSETLLPNSCSYFDNFYCNQHNCSVWSYYTKSIDYPTFTATAYQVMTDVYFDYANWKLGTYGYLTTTCSSGSSTYFGYGRGGVIGLGFNDGAGRNFIGSQIFSIYFNKTLDSGKLLFRYDSSIGASASPIYLNTDINYKASFTSAIISVGYYSTYISGSLIFDVHAKAIGFPVSTFNSIVSYIRYTQSVSCSSDYTNPTCSYYGYISNLPTIKINLGSGVGTIELPPSVYVKNPSSAYQYGITLNLQALSNTLSGSNYVTYSFKDTIIMDAQFMSYYYLVFERYSVTLHVQGSTIPSKAGYAVFGVIVLVFISSICCCIFKKKKKFPAPSAFPSQEPTMIQPSYNPAPMQPNNGYVYPQNNYPVVHQQYAQQPAGYIQQPAGYVQQQQQQPGYYAPQQFQQPGYNYGE